eukprot:1355816-Alexandrium_andersonii.AAC.1
MRHTHRTHAHGHLQQHARAGSTPLAGERLIGCWPDRSCEPWANTAASWPLGSSSVASPGGRRRNVE